MNCCTQGRKAIKAQIEVMLNENEISRIVVGLCFKIHQRYGSDLFENVYEEIFCYEFGKSGIPFTRQHAIPLVQEGVRMDIGFRSDIIIDAKVILELKSILALAPVHFKKMLTYLKLTDLKLGQLINFNVNLIRDGIHRIANKL